MRITNRDGTPGERRVPLCAASAGSAPRSAIKSAFDCPLSYDVSVIERLEQNDDESNDRDDYSGSCKSFETSTLEKADNRCKNSKRFQHYPDAEKSDKR